MIYGYARVSTKKQAKDGNSLKGQEQLLKENGAKKIYKDAYTGTKRSRPEFDKLLNDIKSGDKLIVTKLDRFARSSIEGAKLIQDLLEQGISVRILNMGEINNTPTGKLIMQIFLAFAEFERNMIIERTSEGKAIARASGKLKEGRPKKYSTPQLEHAFSLLNEMPISEVVRVTGISKSTIIRYKREKENNN